jgi:hypothetical protein
VGYTSRTVVKEKSFSWQSVESVDQYTWIPCADKKKWTETSMCNDLKAIASALIGYSGMLLYISDNEIQGRSVWMDLSKESKECEDNCAL